VRQRLAGRLDALILLAALLGPIGLLPLMSAGDGTAAAASEPPPSAAIASDGGSPVAVAPSGSPGPSHGPSPVVSVDPNVARVTSVSALLASLRNNRIGEIIVADGTYHVSPSGGLSADSLWIGEQFASRTRPVVVRAETPGGVIFDGAGGGDGYGGLSFEDGAHDQTWDGFTFANMKVDLSGVIEIGGYTARAAPHHITLRNITIEASCTGSSTSRSAPAVDHAVYIANALDPGPHDIAFENLTVDGRGGLASAMHFFHSTPAAPNASDLTVRGLQVIGTQQAIMLWDPTLRNIRFDDVRITNALVYAVRYETVGAKGIVLSDVRSTGSGFAGFFSSRGSSPSGITITNSVLR